MESLYRLEALVLLLGAVLILMALARRVLIPYPIFLVIGGLILGFLPGVPAVRLDPEIVFTIFLPPILWAAAYFTSLRDFQAKQPGVGVFLATAHPAKFREIVEPAIGERVELPAPLAEALARPRQSTRVADAVVMRSSESAGAGRARCSGSCGTGSPGRSDA